MADFDFITARLATGAAINGPEEVQELLEQGVTHVIDCRTEFDDAALLAVDPQVSYLYNGTADDGQSKPTAWFEKSIEFALSALAQPKHKVYAHCAAGVNRGPSTAYAILRAFGFSQLGAESLIRVARPQVGLAYQADADRAIAELGFG